MKQHAELELCWCRLSWEGEVALREHARGEQGPLNRDPRIMEVLSPCQSQQLQPPKQPPPAGSSRAAAQPPPVGSSLAAPCTLKLKLPSSNACIKRAFNSACRVHRQPMEWLS